MFQYFWTLMSILRAESYLHRKRGLGRLAILPRHAKPRATFITLGTPSDDYLSAYQQTDYSIRRALLSSLRLHLAILWWAHESEYLRVLNQCLQLSFSLGRKGTCSAWLECQWACVMYVLTWNDQITCNRTLCHFLVWESPLNFIWTIHRHSNPCQIP